MDLTGTKPTFLTRQDMERIAQQGVDPALLPDDETAKYIAENNISLTIIK